MLMKAQSGTLTGVSLFLLQRCAVHLAEPASDTPVKQAASETAQGVAWRTEREVAG